MTTQENPDGLSVPELLADLDERISDGIGRLYEMRNPIHANNPDHRDAIRLDGKIQGLEVVRDWLRSYSTPENTASLARANGEVDE